MPEFKIVHNEPVWERTVAHVTVSEKVAKKLREGSDDYDEEVADKLLAKALEDGSATVEVAGRIESMDADMTIEEIRGEPLSGFGSKGAQIAEVFTASEILGLMTDEEVNALYDRLRRDGMLSKVDEDEDTADADERKFYKSTYTTTVVSDRPLSTELELKDVAEQIVSGDLEGEVEAGLNVEITPQEAARLMLEHGSDPSFFGLDDHGNTLDD